jgi:1-aminocyclopropane-1-carboxylate deaminase/D-cysteine desulfhydrase-like pyridoxal-dependent ACC family enzyme
MNPPNCEPQTTPIVWLPGTGRPGVWMKRDDQYVYAGQAGGKVRTCLVLARRQPEVPLVTASARVSPQQLIVASIAHAMRREAYLHVPASRQKSETLERAIELGAQVVEHRPGYNTVIAARARQHAAAEGWCHIPFGMECWEAVWQTAQQAESLPVKEIDRIVVPVGSGMSLAGILTGLATLWPLPPVLGVVVGADPTRRLDRYAPPFWRQMVELVPAGMDYHEAPACTSLYGVPLDPYYEAKAAAFVEPGDLLWVVGTRNPTHV